MILSHKQESRAPRKFFTAGERSNCDVPGRMSRASLKHLFFFFKHEKCISIVFCSISIAFLNIINIMYVSIENDKN